MLRCSVTVSALVSALLLFACATTQPESRGSAAPADAPSGAPGESADGAVQATISMQDGTSLDHAIVIDAASETEGGTLEFRWVAEHFPRYRLKKQSVTKYEGRHFDVLQITDAAGEEHLIYFDITAFIGKK